MASILPKLKLFIFISLLCLLINISACAIAYLNSEQNINDYTVFHNNEIQTVTIQTGTNISITNFAVATVTSFVPFADLISLAFLGLDIITSLILGIVIALFGALKLLLIAYMVLGSIPFINT